MITNNFEYTKPSTLQEALQNMTHGRALSGGQSLIPSMKLRLDSPEKLVDLSQISELKSITDDGSSIKIGAMCTHQDIASHSLVKDHCSILSLCASDIGDVQVRNSGTIGGSLAHADPAADYPAVMVATDAVIHLASQNGTRTKPASEFFMGFFETALNDGEIITAVEIPKLSASHKSCYTKCSQPASRFAIVGCAVVLDVQGGEIKNAKVGFTGVSYNAFLDEKMSQGLVGRQLNEETAKAVSEMAAQDAEVLSDHYADEEYRSQMAKVYAKRAIQGCM